MALLRSQMGFRRFCRVRFRPLDPRAVTRRRFMSDLPGVPDKNISRTMAAIGGGYYLYSAWPYNGPNSGIGSQIFIMFAICFLGIIISAAPGVAEPFRTYIVYGIGGAAAGTLVSGSIGEVVGIYKWLTNKETPNY